MPCPVSWYGPKRTSTHYPVPLRRVRYYDADTEEHFVFLTNAFDLPALTIAQLYKGRWQIGLFFKGPKQHLHIKAFYGLTPNAVKTQIWIAIGVYVLIAIVKKRLGLAQSLDEILQILSITLFEKARFYRCLATCQNKRHHGQGRGRGYDHFRWPNAYIAAHGLFSLHQARTAVAQPSCR